MKITKTFAIVIATIISCYASGWGRIGHDAVAYIAEQNLTPKAKKIISHYLDGKSIVYYSSWADDIRFTKEYKRTSHWHVFKVKANGKLALRDGFGGKYKGDNVVEIENMISALEGGKYKSLPDSVVIDYIKFLTHFIGDLHCPAHSKIEGISTFTVATGPKVIIGGVTMPFHSFWDNGLLANIHAWGYMEYYDQLARASKKEIKEIVAESPRDWALQNYKQNKEILKWNIQENQTIGKDIINKARPIVDKRIEIAGYRLAKVLNEIFK